MYLKVLEFTKPNCTKICLYLIQDVRPLMNDQHDDRNKLMLSNLLQQFQQQFQLVTLSQPGFMQLTVLTGVHHLSSCLRSTI